MGISKQISIVILAIIIILFLLLGNYYFYLNNKSYIVDDNLDNIMVENNIIEFDSLTLKQKLAQMIITRGDSENYEVVDLNIGGIFLDRLKYEDEYKRVIDNFQEKSKIKLFVTTDMEGAWTPFPEPEEHQKFPKFSEIETSEEAFEVGKAHGELLKKIGFNLNFAPVAEYVDDAYGGRTFSGTDEEIQEKVASYIKGLQENVMGTCKHYPGESLHTNLHEKSATVEIRKKDLELFRIGVKNNISAIMVSHQITTGLIDSKGKPATVSKEVIDSLETIGFDGLIIVDEIRMKGLSNFYKEKGKLELYKDLINAGENVILDFYIDTKELDELLEGIVEEVEKGNISEEKINESARKILKYKGYSIK